jgi:sucrose phosphorylase
VPVDPPVGAFPPSRTAPQLIAYADRLGGDLPALTELLRGPLAGAFGGVHILPFFVPFDGADAGFDPHDHARVDPRLGGWPDLRELTRSHTVTADVIVNHISSASEQFRDVVERGARSSWWPMFLTLDSVFPAGASEADLSAIYRPRAGLPFTRMSLGGTPHLVWTTFTPDQVDLDVRQDLTWDYLTGVIDTMCSSGVRTLRLDAIGYVGKEAGTSCFNTGAMFAFLKRLRDHAHARGAEVLVEMHGHWQQQVEIAGHADWVYDFALPPLVLHALLLHDPAPLGRWLAIRPANAVTVLDTHDGIGVVDVAGSHDPHVPGLLGDDEIDRLVERIHDNTGGTSRLASGDAASNLDLYQVNSTFYDALGADADRYLLARMIQLFVPGIPQVYYVGLLAGSNDTDLLARTGVGRDVNRHVYTPDEVRDSLEQPVVRAILAALRLRAQHPAFEGRFEHTIARSVLALSWRRGADLASLRVDLLTSTFVLCWTSDQGTVEITDVDSLAGADVTQPPSPAQKGSP